MARPPKDPNHPLVRLRAILSTPATKRVPANEMSRERFAKKTGIPEPSLKDIETGRYEMTPDVAYKISFTTGVDPQSLLRGDDPLLDFTGQRYSKASSRLDDVLSIRALEDSNLELLRAAWETASEKKMATLFTYMLGEWLRQTFLNLGLGSTYAKAIKRRLEKLNQYAGTESNDSRLARLRLAVSAFKQLAEKKSHSLKTAA
jgi:transcriptional regulator with XRE-family HTH domain